MTLPRVAAPLAGVGSAMRADLQWMIDVPVSLADRYPRNAPVSVILHRPSLNRVGMCIAFSRRSVCTPSVCVLLPYIQAHVQ